MFFTTFTPSSPPLPLLPPLPPSLPSLPSPPSSPLPPLPPSPPSHHSHPSPPSPPSSPLLPLLPSLPSPPTPAPSPTSLLRRFLFYDLFNRAEIFLCQVCKRNTTIKWARTVDFDITDKCLYKGRNNGFRYCMMCGCVMPTILLFNMKTKIIYKTVQQSRSVLKIPRCSLPLCALYPHGSVVKNKGGHQ